MKSASFYIVCLCLTGSVLLSACAQRAEVPDTPDLGSESVNQAVDKETEQVDEAEQVDETGQADEPEWMDETEQTADPKSRELTQEEIAFFDEYLSLRENSGFLLSTYKSAEEIDLHELFYNGAGMSNWGLTEEEAEDYLNAAGADEIYTDVRHLTTSQIDAFLLEKTGLSYEQMQKKLDWVYSAQTDTWYYQAGDTNWRPFACVGGTVADDIYTLYMQAMDREPGYRAELYATVLKKNGDGYQFISNLFMEEEGRIEDQSFALTLEPWGNVTFASYMPAENGDPTADVTFRIIQDGGLLMTLSGVSYDNIRKKQYFLSVDAISFPDFNSDGYTDLITICSYTYDAGGDRADSFAEARIYRGNEWGFLVYEPDMSADANSALAELTTSSVLGFLGVER